MKQTTYTDVRGNIYPAVVLTREEVEIILEPLDIGTPEGDKILAGYCLRQGAPEWVGWSWERMGGEDWGVLGPPIKIIDADKNKSLHIRVHIGQIWRWIDFPADADFDEYRECFAVAVKAALLVMYPEADIKVEVTDEELRTFLCSDGSLKTYLAINRCLEHVWSRVPYLIK